MWSDTSQMNRSLKAKLGTLPYREMLELSREVARELGQPEEPWQPKIADVLSGLAAKEDTDFAKKEQAMLHSLFTRQKQIKITPYEKGWKISIPAQNIDVYSDDVRDGISQALDNLVAIRCME